MVYCGYVKLATMEYPKYLFDILEEHPEIEYTSVEYGEFPHPPTYALVCSSPPPDHDSSTHKAEITTPVFRDGEWYQNWSIVPMTEQEIADTAAFKAAIEAQIAAAREEQAVIDAANAARAAAGSTGTTVTFI
jgi:hypothetical protein